MAEDIKYIGVDPDYTQSPKENNAVSKTKKNKSETKEKFRINKHNSKVDNFIASTKPKYKHTGKLIIVLLILLFVWIFKPINFLKTKLEEKRIHYSMQEDSSSVNLDIKFGLWNNILYYLSYNYYKDLWPSGNMRSLYDFDEMVYLRYSEDYNLCLHELTKLAFNLQFTQKQTYYIPMYHGINVTSHAAPINIRKCPLMKKNILTLIDIIDRIKLSIR